MIRDRIATIAAFSYVIIGVITFGHAAAHSSCLMTEKTHCPDDKSAGGMFWGVLWPLY